MYRDIMDSFLHLLIKNTQAIHLYGSHQGNEYSLVPISFSDTDA